MIASEMNRRSFLKVAGAAAAVAAAGPLLTGEAQAAELDLVAARQGGVYGADAKVYKIRKSQENPSVTKLYAKDGFLPEGPCGHKSHDLLHTHYTDRSAAIKALKAKGVKLKA